MKSYNVWIEIEEYDDGTEKHTNDPEPVKVALFTDRRDAERFVHQMGHIGGATAPSFRGEKVAP